MISKHTKLHTQLHFGETTNADIIYNILYISKFTHYYFPDEESDMFLLKVHLVLYLIIIFSHSNPNIFCFIWVVLGAWWMVSNFV